MRELKLFLATVIAAAVAVLLGFVIYVLVQMYQWASTHQAQMLPWYIGTAIILILLVVKVYRLLSAHHYEKLRAKRLENDHKEAEVLFVHTGKLALEQAVASGANYKIGPDRSLEVIHCLPPTTVTEERTEERKALPSPQIIIPQAPTFRSIAHLMTPDRIILDYTVHGPVYGEINDLLSMALVGKPKRGKTTALLYYLCILLQSGAEVWIWDPHGEMSELAYGLHYYDSLAEISASVPLLWQELNKREELYKTRKQVLHPLVLLVDEIPVITDWEREQIKQKNKVPSPYRMMKRFTLEARKWQGYVFISGQSLPAEVLPTLTRDNLSSRLVLECSADSARMVGLPKQAIDTLLPVLRGADRGTHIADFSSWSHPELADIPYTTIADLREIIDSRKVNDLRSRSRAFTEPMEPLQYVHPAFTATGTVRRSSAASTVSGELVNKPVNEPVNVSEWHSPDSENVIEVSPEEKAMILRLAHAQFKTTGKIVRTKVRDALGWNNKDFAKIKQVLDEEGL